METSVGFSQAAAAKAKHPATAATDQHVSVLMTLPLWSSQTARAGNIPQGRGPKHYGSGEQRAVLAAALGLGDQELAELVGVHGVTEQMALCIVAAVLAEEIELRFGFHAFRDHLELQAVRHLNDRVDDRGIVAVDGHVAHERLVDLQRVDRKLL